MTDIKTHDKIENFFFKEFHQRVGKMAVFKNSDGSYELFDRYTVVPSNNGAYRVYMNFKTMFKVFYSLKNAVTWCTFEKRNKYRETARIEELDRLIEGIDVSIRVHQNIITRNKKPKDQSIYITKLSEDHLKKKCMMNELASFILDSRIWQDKQFNQQNKSKNKDK